MREWNPDRYPCLRDLLEADAAAYEYFHGLPPEMKTALRRRGGILSRADLQSAAAYERESSYF